MASRGLISYASVLNDRFAYVPQDMVVPGILEAADIPDIVAALGSRGVRIEGAVDGRNRALSMAEMRTELRIGQLEESSLTVAENPGGPATVDWMAAQWSR